MAKGNCSSLYTTPMIPLMILALERKRHIVTQMVSTIRLLPPYPSAMTILWTFDYYFLEYATKVVPFVLERTHQEDALYEAKLKATSKGQKQAKSRENRKKYYKNTYKPNWLK
jgi:hypothetical protein